jgi:hypothetical protein
MPPVDMLTCQRGAVEILTLQRFAWIFVTAGHAPPTVSSMVSARANPIANQSQARRRFRRLDSDSRDAQRPVAVRSMDPLAVAHAPAVGVFYFDEFASVMVRRTVKHDIDVLI